MKSYYMPYGASRSGCVDAPVRPRYTLRVVADITAISELYVGAGAGAGSVRSVMVSPDGAHLAVQWDRAYTVRTRTWEEGLNKDGMDNTSVFLSKKSFLEGEESGAYPNKPQLPWKRSPPDIAYGKFFFIEQSGDLLISAAQAPSDTDMHPPPGQPWQLPPYVNATATRMGKRVMRSGEVRPEPKLLWSTYESPHQLVGEGVAVLTEDHRVAIAMQDGAFVILDGLRGTRLVDRRLSAPAFELARIGRTFVALSKQDGGTQVTSLDDKGDVRWTTHLDFVAEEPPVQGSGGRVHIFGRGWATLDDTGAIVHKRSDGVRARGTSFHSGSLVVATKNLLEIRRPDGTVALGVLGPGGATFATPPAIGHDGAIFIATDTHLYVAE